MSSGFTRDGNVQEQIDVTIADAVERARLKVPVGVSPTFCRKCGSTIPRARREALPGVKLCVFCAIEQEQLR